MLWGSNDVIQVKVLSKLPSSMEVPDIIIRKEEHSFLDLSTTKRMTTPALLLTVGVCWGKGVH